MEQLIVDRSGRTGTGVADAESCAGVGANKLDDNAGRHGFTGHRRIDGVKDEIRHNLSQRFRIALDGDWFRRRGKLQVDSGVKTIERWTAGGSAAMVTPSGPEETLQISNQDLVLHFTSHGGGYSAAAPRS